MSFFPQSTFFDLGLLGKTLDAFQYAANVTSDNIANVNTPGASRQVVDLTEAQPIAGSPFYGTHVAGTVGDGAIVQQVERIHADSYDALFRGASSSQNFYGTQQNALTALQATLGDPNSGIGAQYTAFQTAIAQLVAQSGSGQSASVRASVLAQAQALTSSLNAAASGIAQQKVQVMQQAGSLVTTANGILDQIGALNGQIRASTAVGDSPNTFKDQRDHLIDQLSQYLSTQTSIQPDGSTLVSVNGQALVNDTVVYHLAQPVVGTAANGTPTFKIDFASTPPAAANAPGVPLGSGQLAGLADLYNAKLQTYGVQLDQFASSLAASVNRVTQAAYDQNGQPGAALFQPIVGAMPISAGNITCGISDPSQLPVALANTAAGSLVTPMNSANNAVDTSAALNGNQTLANPPVAAGIAGTLTVSVDGVARTFAYSTAAGGNAATIDGFVTSFNTAHLGVTASFDAASQRIVFARDPGNADLVHDALQAAAGTPTGPAFTIADSNFAAATPSTSLVGVLGAGAIDGVQQDAANAFGSADNGAANALVKLFGSNVGVPTLQTQSAVAAAPSVPTTVALPAGVANVMVGQVLTLDAQPGGVAPQENVTVSAVSVNPATGVESVTYTTANAHAAGYAIAAAPVQTLGQFYGQFVTRVGLDAQTATAGNTAQTALASNIDKVRQSISGINIDEETQNLIKYQNAYQATARTLNVMDSLLGTIINNLGVGQ